MKMKALAIVLASLTAAGCESLNANDRGGSVAVMIDRKFGSSRDAYSSERGIMYSSPGSAHAATLRSEGVFRLVLKFDDGHLVQTSMSFPADTPIESVTTRIAQSLRDQGLEVSAVPEFGTFRISFASGLVEVTAGGPDGLTVVDHMGQRSEVVALHLEPRS